MKSYSLEYKKPNVRGPYFLKIRDVRIQRNSEVRNGKLVLRPNPLNVTTQLWTFEQVDVRNKKSDKILLSDTANRYMPTEETLNFSPSEDARALIEVENKLLQKVAGIRTNALELYATRIETANMVCKRIGQLTNALLCLKRGRWKQFKKQLKLNKNIRKPGAHKFEDIPALWLEYSFGWKPLLSDIYNILDNTFEAPHAKCKASYSINFEGPYAPNTRSPQVPGIVQKRCKYTACVDVKVNVPVLSAISQYGVNNPLAVAWELVPYSFVVDWFLPVGDYIEQMGATAGLAMSNFNITSTTTTFCSYTSNMSDWYISQGYSSDYYWNKSPSVFCKHVFKKRILIDRQPVYRFLFPESPMKQTLQRVSYALSLLSLAFGRKPK